MKEEIGKEELPKLYKFNSVTLNLHLEHTTAERQTYSLLDWIGDIGGLFDGLRIFIGKIIAPIAAIALRSDLLTLNFRQVVRANASNVDQQHTEGIILPSCLCGNKKKNRYRKMLQRSDSIISK